MAVKKRVMRKGRNARFIKIAVADHVKLSEGERASQWGDVIIVSDKAGGMVKAFSVGLSELKPDSKAVRAALKGMTERHEATKAARAADSDSE